MDNNLFANPEYPHALEYLIDNRILSDLNQGLDFRLTDNLSLLSQVRHTEPFTFAFDDISYEKAWNDKIGLIKHYIPSDWGIRLYLYYRPNMNGGIKGLIHRANWCKNHKCLPYIMRDSLCWTLPDPDRHFITDFTAYVNQPNMYKKLTFEEFIYKRHPNNEIRQKSSLKIFLDNLP